MIARTYAKNLTIDHEHGAASPNRLVPSADFIR